jgi:hypothetical protein
MKVVGADSFAVEVGPEAGGLLVFEAGIIHIQDTTTMKTEITRYT